MNITVTGATGFIGQALVHHLVEQGHSVSAWSRSKNKSDIEVETNFFDLNDITGNDDLVSVLTGVDVLIHLAAKVHEKEASNFAEIDIFSKLNVDATLALANQAAKAGVKRFVFMSSIGVNGQYSGSKPFEEDDIPRPYNSYTRTKYEAEIGLLDIAKSKDIEIVIIRPPLAYGCQAPGNFSALLSLVKRNIPMPFGRVNNRRSFIALENLVDFTGLCANIHASPNAANQVFLVSDRQDVSTRCFIKKLAFAHRKNILLLPIPVSIMNFFANLVGKGDIAKSIFADLQINSLKAKSFLGWEPPYNMDDQFQKIAETKND